MRYARIFGLLCSFTCFFFLSACGGNASPPDETGYLVVSVSTPEAIELASTELSFADDLSFEGFVNATDTVYVGLSESPGKLNVTFVAASAFTGELGQFVFKRSGNSEGGVSFTPLRVSDAKTLTLSTQQETRDSAPAARANPEEMTGKTVPAAPSYSLAMADDPLGDINASGGVSFDDARILREMLFADKAASDLELYHADLILDGTLGVGDILQLVAKAEGYAEPLLHAVPRELAVADGETALIIVGNAGVGETPELEIQGLFTGEAASDSLTELAQGSRAQRVFELTGTGSSEGLTFSSEAGTTTVFNNLGVERVSADSATLDALKSKAEQSADHAQLKSYLGDQGFRESGQAEASVLQDQGRPLVSFYVQGYSKASAEKAFLVYAEDESASLAYASLTDAEGQLVTDVWVDERGVQEQDILDASLSVSGNCAQVPDSHIELLGSGTASTQVSCQECSRSCRRTNIRCTLGSVLLCAGVGIGGTPVAGAGCTVVMRWFCLGGYIKCDTSCRRGENCDPDPDPNPDPERPDEPPCRSCGDPHLYTLDGLHYDFQAAGEFVLLESTTDDMTVQVRQEPWNDSDIVSINTAVAMNVNGDRVAVYYLPREELRINGQVRTLDASLDLDGGGKVFLVGTSYLVAYPDGSVVSARLGGSFLDVGVELAAERQGNIRGLLGDFDGDSDNDIRSRDGETFESPVDFEAFYGDYGNSWRITQAESLFDYEAGQTTDSYTLADFPAVQASSATLTEEQRRTATRICQDAGITDEIALETCIIDVGLTGDENFVVSAADAPRAEGSLAVGATAGYEGRLAWSTMVFALAPELRVWDMPSSRFIVSRSVEEGKLQSFLTPNLSADGDTLAYTFTEGSPFAGAEYISQAKLVDFETGAILSVPRTTGNANEFRYVLTPSVSNDQQLVFSQSTISFAEDTFGDESDQNIALWDGSGQPRLLTTNTADDTCPRISADGGTVVFLSDRDISKDFYVTGTAEGSTPRRISYTQNAAIEGINEARFFCPYQLSDDGKTLAFIGDLADNKRGVFVIDTDSGEVAQVATAALGDPFTFSLSGDGERLVFTSTEIRNPDTADISITTRLYGVSLVSPNSAVLIRENRLTSAGYSDPDGIIQSSMLALSGDGRAVALTQLDPDGGLVRLTVMRFDGSDERTISNKEEDVMIGALDLTF